MKRAEEKGECYIRKKVVVAEALNANAAPPFPSNLMIGGCCQDNFLPGHETQVYAFKEVLYYEEIFRRLQYNLYKEVNGGIF